MLEVRKIVKNGNAYSVAIPKPFLSALSICRGKHVVVELRSGYITIRPLRQNEIDEGGTIL